MTGLFLFHKPIGISSAGFLNKLKRYAGKEKLGHGGTLDPLAQGLLVVAIGRSYTKKLAEILKGVEKEYLATVVLGAWSNTYDREGEIEQREWKETYTKKELPKKIKEVVEQIAKRKTQVPPPYSAIKIEGKPAYKRSRKGESVSLPSRPVKIVDWSVEEITEKKSGVEVKIRLVVSSGFYVRSFAHDLGEALGTGGYLQELTRTRVGDFQLPEALSMEDLAEKELELYFQASGRVQGVGYRYFTQKTSQNRAITGFVRNIRDSSVEVVGRAKLAVLSPFLDDLKRGPENAEITSTFDYFRKPQGEYVGFSIRE